MAILAKHAVTEPNVETVLYVVPEYKSAVFALNVCNRTNSDTLLRVAVRSEGEETTADAGYLEFDTLLPAGGVFERTGFTLAGNEQLTVQSSLAGVSFVALGMED